MTEGLVVAVLGGVNIELDQEKLARELGAMLAREGLGLATGACKGYPDFVADSYLRAGGTNFTAISPFGSLDEHMAKGFPLYEGSNYLFPHLEGSSRGLGFGRQALIVEAADVAVVFDGGCGTISEAMQMAKAGRDVIIVGPPTFNEILSAALGYDHSQTRGRVWRVDPRHRLPTESIQLLLRDLPKAPKVFW